MQQISNQTCYTFGVKDQAVFKFYKEMFLNQKLESFNSKHVGTFWQLKSPLDFRRKFADFIKQLVLKNQNPQKTEILGKQNKQILSPVECQLQAYMELNKINQISVKKLQDQVKQGEAKIAHLLQQAQSFVRTIKILDKDRFAQKSIIKKQETQIQAQKNQIKDYQKGILLLQEQIKSLQKQSTSLMNKIQTTEDVINAAENPQAIKQLNERNQAMNAMVLDEQKEKQKQNTIIPYEKQIQQIKQSYQKKIKKLQKQINSLKDQIQISQVLSKSHQQQTQKKIAHLISKHREQTEKILKNRQDLQLQLQILQSQKQQQCKPSLNSYESQLNMLKQMINSLKNLLLRKEQQIKGLSHNLKIANQKLKEFKQPSQALQKQEKQTQTVLIKQVSRLFNRSILEIQDDKTQLIINAIEQNVGLKSIKSAKLLYSYDPLNPTSFHQYIDGKENFLIVIQSRNNKFFGAFSTSFFQPNYKQPESIKAFLFTFNPELRDPITCFNLKKANPKAKSLSWDESFLIIGNSDIRWRKGQNKILSNFALPQGFYDPKGCKVKDFLQEGDEREVLIKGFECLQIQFDQ